MARPTVDPEAVLASRRAEGRLLSWEPVPPDDLAIETGDASGRSRSALEYLHHHWVLPDHADGTVGGGVRGRVVAAVGRLTFRILGPYLHQEREVLGHLVRTVDALQQQCDELAEQQRQLTRYLGERQALAAWLEQAPGTGHGPGPDAAP